MCAMARVIGIEDWKCAAGNVLNGVRCKGIYPVDWNSVRAENYVVLYRRN